MHQIFHRQTMRRSWLITVDEEGTQEILKEYQHNFSNSIPNAYIRMKQLTMINVLAPIEVRISGDSIADLKAVSAKVEAIATESRCDVDKNGLRGNESGLQ